MTDPVLAVLPERIPYILFGTAFLLIGLCACGFAAMHHRSRLKLLTWLGLWSAFEGTRYLFGSLLALGLLPHWLDAGFPYLDVVLSYLVVVVALMAFLQLSQGKLRIFLQSVILVGLTVALAGIAFFLLTGSPHKLMLYNQLLAACSIAVLGTVVAVPRLSRKFLILHNRSVISAGILLFAMEAMYGTLSLPLGYPSPPEILDPSGFAVLLFCFGYVAAQRLEISSLPPAGHRA